MKWIFTAFFILATVACSPLGAPLEDASLSSTGDRPERVTIQKAEGLNINEADAIWVAGMLRAESYGSSYKREVKVHRLDLKSGLSFPVRTWDLTLLGDVAYSGSGIRTFVAEEGFLMVKAGGTTISLYRASPNKDQVEKLWSISNGYSRGIPLAYRVIKNGKQYDYYGIATKESGSDYWWRVYRLLKQGDKLVQVRPYRIYYKGDDPSITIYTGYLDTCSTKASDNSGNCAPQFFGGKGSVYFGVNLAEVDIPGTPGTNPITVPNVAPKNRGFASTSHPMGGKYGVLNHSLYSMSGDDQGNILLAHFNATSRGADYTAFDKVNRLVYHVNRATNMKPEGRSGSASAAIAIYKRECFSSLKECDPSKKYSGKTRSKIFLDVGNNVGPSSDLGNGCVAILSLEKGAGTGVVKDNKKLETRIYQSCIKNPNDIEEGITMTLLGKVDGAAYMYNDFTGATLYDRPNYIFYDFEKMGFPSIKDVQFHWVPRIGYTKNPKGIRASFRCYRKNEKPAGDDGFKEFSIGVGLKPHDLAGCGGKGISQVEIKMERDKSKELGFTRFQFLSLTASKGT